MERARHGTLKELNLTVAGRGSETGNQRCSADEWFTPLRFGIILTLFLLIAFWKVATGQHSFF
ncbi:MAG: hypothetical protein DME26_12150 [Verrucomicrobia bacterium]|nr:MAG: hypothetical protein DME26_12150 [Verrucomicrobiota bacterium]